MFASLRSVSIKRQALRHYLQDAMTLRHWYLHNLMLCESHHRQVVDRSFPAYRTYKTTPESHHRQVVDRSIPALALNDGKQGLGMNDPPPAGGGIVGNLSSPCRLGLNDPSAPADGIRLNIICVDTNDARSWHRWDCIRCFFLSAVLKLIDAQALDAKVERRRRKPQSPRGAVRSGDASARGA